MIRPAPHFPQQDPCVSRRGSSFLCRLPTAGMLVVALAAAGPALAEPAARGAEVDAFRTRLEKWVETRRILSEEKTGWEVERETLRDTRRLLQQQKQELESKLAEAEQETSEAEEARRELLLERAGFQRANRALEEQIRQLEERTLALVERLPEPLVSKIEPLTAQIPEDATEASESSLGQRLVTVLGVLSQAEQFDANAHLVGETRAVGGDQKVAIRTLYWGLGQAVYAAAQGRAAGVARPGPAGWEFHDKSALTSDAELLLDIYEGNVDTIEFIPMPIQTGASRP